ncbi:MAG TPA: hypothetical protein VGA94_02490 [Thermodesulfobacteriota bacterium]|jgi:hypothetical protein
MKCIICEQRKAKRYCPAKRRSICPVCCGEKRGVEINCPLDCPYYVEGQKYQQEKITRQRLKKEGVQPYIRRAELYNKNPEIFAKIELALATLFRMDGKLTNGEVAEALELVIKTLDTEKKGILYEYRSENRIVNELSGRVLDILREYTDRTQVGQGRVSLDYARDVVEEFLKEIRFYIEMDSNPQSYLIHVSRYHPEKSGATQGGGSLIMSP